MFLEINSGGIEGESNILYSRLSIGFITSFWTGVYVHVIICIDTNTQESP